ncbi:hypothetical protein L798_06887 [Zootermopsis nevadensis]|uniref:Uncharacterized protein n=1 Tax=Zootermopsis nevadensis TaxID=136037 RepID=A0A067RGM3_ZOONE|nr:hypothetical protein L798_06887 [Zootermopsis nevadensis]
MRLSWPSLTQTPAAAGAAMTTHQPETQPPPELESEIDESELRRELLNDVSPSDSFSNTGCRCGAMFGPQDPIPGKRRLSIGSSVIQSFSFVYSVFMRHVLVDI